MQTAGILQLVPDVRAQQMDLAWEARTPLAIKPCITQSCAKSGQGEKSPGGFLRNSTTSSILLRQSFLGGSRAQSGDILFEKI